MADDKAFNNVRDQWAYRVAPIMTFETWASAYGIPTSGGHTNDSELDGYVDLLEYALGSLPTNASSLARLDANVDAMGSFSLWFARYANTTDISLFVESTDSLVPATTWRCILSNMNARGWSGQASYIESAPTSGIAKVRITNPDTASTNKFVRVRVEKH